MRIRRPLRTLFRVLWLKAPIDAQLIVTRRCNLSCGYCSEYDQVSQPIPLEVLKERIDALHRLRVINITLLGGEPLLHPQIDAIVAHAARHAQVSITTNGFPLTDRLIQRLNRAGLSNMQISVDTLSPDPTGYIQKCLIRVMPKLERLKRLAEFDTHINIVLCESSKAQFKELLHEVRRLGFPVSVYLVHDDRGRVQIEGPEYLELWEYYVRNGTLISLLEYEYGKQLLQGHRPRWQCRAGARFLYVDEFGKVQFCSGQRGRLNKPVTQYTYEDIRKHATTYKGCESGCSKFCVYRCSQIDNAPLQVIRAVTYYMKVHRSLFRRTRAFRLRWQHGEG